MSKESMRSSRTSWTQTATRTELRFPWISLAGRVNRLIKAYKEAGKAAFHHGNAGRKPATTVPSETRQLIVDLYRAKYYEANFTHYAELLECYEQIRLSVPTIASILEAEGILSPRVTRAKKKRIKKRT